MSWGVTMVAAAFARLRALVRPHPLYWLAGFFAFAIVGQIALDAVGGQSLLALWAILFQPFLWACLLEVKAAQIERQDRRSLRRHRHDEIAKYAKDKRKENL